MDEQAEPGPSTPVPRGRGDGSQLCRPRGGRGDRRALAAGAYKPWMGKAWRSSLGAGWCEAPKGMLCGCPRASVSPLLSLPLLPSGLRHDQERLFLSPEDAHCWLTLLCPVSQGQGSGEPSPVHRPQSSLLPSMAPSARGPLRGSLGGTGCGGCPSAPGLPDLRAKPCSQASQSPALALSCSDQRGVV